MNNLVSGQRSPRIESLNGELTLMSQSSRCPDDDFPTFRQYTNETYIPKHPRRCTQDRVQPGSDYASEIDRLNAEIKKFNYRCEENLQKYPQRCREEYQRCSDNNLIYDQYTIENKYGADLQRRTRGYSEDLLRYRDDEYRNYIDLQKFPQRYCEDSVRPLDTTPQTLKYNDIRYNQHDIKYPIHKNILPNRILDSGRIPITGLTTIGLVVNRFGSAPLNHDMNFGENSLYPGDNTEDELINRRFIVGSMSDND